MIRLKFSSVVLVSPACLYQFVKVLKIQIYGKIGVINNRIYYEHYYLSSALSVACYSMFIIICILLIRLGTAGKYFRKYCIWLCHNPLICLLLMCCVCLNRSPNIQFVDIVDSCLK